MRSVPLQRGYVTLVDDEDFEAVAAIRWCIVVSSYGSVHAKVGNAKCRNGVRRLHHFIFERSTGITVPTGMQIDHANGDTMDNRRANLRLCTASQNCANRYKTRERRGVYQAPNGKWRASVNSKGKRYHLGYFDDVEQAARARDRKATELFGEFAVLNFPESHNATS